MKIYNSRLAFSTLGCPEWDLKTIAQEAQAMGFSAVEIRGIGAETEADRIDCFSLENRAKSLELLESCGVKLCVFGSSACFHDPERTEAALKEAKAAIDLCRAMNIPAVRVFGDIFPAGESPEHTVDRVAKGISALCQYAEETGFVQVLLEVHGDFNTVKVYTRLLPQMAGHPSFGLIWDIEHSFRAYGENFEPFYHIIRPYIRHIHVKDCRIQGGQTEICLPGEGEINIREILKALEQDGYAGYYSFEWEKRWHPEIAPPESAFRDYLHFMGGEI